MVILHSYVTVDQRLWSSPAIHGSSCQEAEVVVFIPRKRSRAWCSSSEWLLPWRWRGANEEYQFGTLMYMNRCEQYVCVYIYIHIYTLINIQIPYPNNLRYLSHLNLEGTSSSVGKEKVGTLHDHSDFRPWRSRQYMDKNIQSPPHTLWWTPRPQISMFQRACDVRGLISFVHWGACASNHIKIE